MHAKQKLRKQNKRYTLYLIIGGIILILALILGFFLSNHNAAEQKKTEQFATNHFNPNVTIYGVAVGNLTVKQATKKINRKANNIVLLESGTVSLAHDDSVSTITQTATADYFKKQHTKQPSKQNYKFTNTALLDAKAKLTKISRASLTYKVANKKYQLKASKLINEAKFRDGKYLFSNVENLTDKLSEIDKDVSTLHKSYKFAVPVGDKIKGKTITIKNESYGWGINVDKAVKAVERAFLDGTKTLDGEDYIYGLGYSTYGLGYNEPNQGIGQNYIVVSLKRQELWIIRKNKIAVHLNDVVTGTKNDNKGNRTPVGVWYIHYKKKHAVLRGRNSDGSKYASKVEYWMPFTLTGCGLHDANWRTDWSKTAYLRGGSHGCINIKPSEIYLVWQNVLIHDPVIVYD
ncbi:L,D-transpeptidase family protein [Lactobacillus sp. ESL0791]|uniref:L,D-transpeptidase family protein n=1 Tax=Lactobacillus sp. ESL0791 TaxID=2983234 RepID=UPI0023F81097|nr:L,D-transpeptidase family protein [Lactobacillus sp. ESL0791]MDF7639706.1 L,D-transpeptidase family protein [Lactobacillus sp. ESL0791]